MPRTKPTTSRTERTILDYLIQEALGKILTEDGNGILLERSLSGNFDSSRYSNSGVNKIDTFWT